MQTSGRIFSDYTHSHSSHRKREALRHSPKVRTAAWHFWATFGVGVHGRIGHDEYKRVHRLIAKALAPELTDEEAAEACEYDWEEDLADHKAGHVLEADQINFHLFSDGLLGIADMWTEHVNEFEYAVFLQRLYRRITKPSGGARGSSGG